MGMSLAASMASMDCLWRMSCGVSLRVAFGDVLGMSFAVLGTFWGCLVGDFSGDNFAVGFGGRLQVCLWICFWTFLWDCGFRCVLRNVFCGLLLGCLSSNVVGMSW